MKNFFQSNAGNCASAPTHSKSMWALYLPLIFFIFLLLQIQHAAAQKLGDTQTREACSWDRPGHLPFAGVVHAAVDRYKDLPNDVRTRLKERMASHSYDDVVEIRRDSIVGVRRYSPDIKDMHFANGLVCKTTTRSKWTDSMMERGLVYCEADECILVPFVCRNVSRLKRLPEAVLSREVEGEPTMPSDADVSQLSESPATTNAVPADVEVVDNAYFADPIGQGLPANPAAFFPSRGVSPLSARFTPILNLGSPVAPTTPIPEPGSWALMGLGLVGLAVFTRRRKPRD